VLDLRVSSTIIIGVWHSLPLSKPPGAIYTAVDLIRRLLRNERVTAEGTFFQVRNLCPYVLVRSYRIIPIYSGALNPDMLRLTTSRYLMCPASLPALMIPLHTAVYAKRAVVLRSVSTSAPALPYGTE